MDTVTKTEGRATPWTKCKLPAHRRGHDAGRSRRENADHQERSVPSGTRDLDAPDAANHERCALAVGAQVGIRARAVR